MTGAQMTIWGSAAAPGLACASGIMSLCPFDKYQHLLLCCTWQERFVWHMHSEPQQGDQIYAHITDTLTRPSTHLETLSDPAFAQHMGWPRLVEQEAICLLRTVHLLSLVALQLSSHGGYCAIVTRCATFTMCLYVTT